jgi:hypothetical protein
METKSVKESVELRQHGTVDCCNRADDVRVVVKLLNAIPEETGGTKGAPLSVPKRIGHRFIVVLARAIREFQRRQNDDYSRSAMLLVNGHVKTGDRTMRRLIETAIFARVFVPFDIGAASEAQLSNRRLEATRWSFRGEIHFE